VREESAQLFAPFSDDEPPSQRSMRTLRRALLLSCAVHALLLIGYVTRDLETQALFVETLKSFEVVLTPPRSEQTSEPVAPGIAEALVTEPAQVVESLPEVDQSEADPSELLASPAPTSPAPGQKLNLQRPSNWESLVLDNPDATEGLVFKSSDRTAIGKRRAQQDVQRALSRAQIARLGLPGDTYRRQTDAGEEVKTAKGCFIKRQEQGPSGGQIRWWPTRCVDSKKPAWKREVLSFGPDHKVDNNPADSKSDCPNGRCWAY